MKKTRATRKATTSDLLHQATSSSFAEAVQHVAGGMNTRNQKLLELQAKRTKLVEAKNAIIKDMKSIRKSNKKSDKVLRKKSTVDLVRELSLRLGNNAEPNPDAETDIELPAEEPPASGE